MAELMRRYGGLRLAVISDTAGSAASADSAVARLVRLGVERERLDTRHEEGSTPRIVPYPADRQP